MSHLHSCGLGLLRLARQLNLENAVGDVLTDARYDGTFGIDLLDDRGRRVGSSKATRQDLANA